MANQDPAFQAAPILGGTSYDPIQFARRQRLEKFQIQRKREEEQARNTAKGLEDLMVDVKGWEDQKGFQEIMADQNRVMNGFLNLSKKGMNLVSPKTTQEIMAYKAINDEHQKIKQKVDTWNQQKGVYDLYQKAIEEDNKLDPDQQKIDHVASAKNMQTILNTKSIGERAGLLTTAVVPKIQPGDIVKQIIADKDFYIPPTQTQVVTPNPETGQNEVTMTENMSKADLAENVRRAGARYSGLSESYKAGLRQIKANDPNEQLRVMSDKDYYATLAVPTYRKKFIEKPVGSGSGFSLNFGGSKIQVTPGELQTNDNMIGGRNYNQRYDFQTKGQLVKVPTTGGYQHDSDPKANDDGWHEITGGDYAEAELLFYDPKSDQLVFRTGQAAKNPWIDNNITFSVPRKNVPDAEKLPIMDHGKKKTLKDVLPAGETAPVLRTIGGKDFRATTPYIPKKK